jgi:hypothetical protein
MFAVLLANGAPAPFPQSASSPTEWAVWGACMSVAVALGGWALLNRNRPARDGPVGAALLVAVGLAILATVFAVSKNHARQMDQNRQEQEQHERFREPEHIPPPG